MKETKTAVIYKFENKLNGHIYIGQSINERRRYYRHLNKKDAKYPIDLAIKKYGIEQFDYTILYQFQFTDKADAKRILNEKEIQYIKQYNCISPNGYNIKPGGNEKGCSPELSQKLSEACKGEKNGFYGKKHSEETRRKMSEAAKRRGNNNVTEKRKPLSPEKMKIANEKRRMWREQYMQTDEYKVAQQRKSEQMKQYHKEHPRKYTEEYKKQLSLAHIGKYYKPSKSRSLNYYLNDKFVRSFDYPGEAARFFKGIISFNSIVARLNGQYSIKYPEIKFIYQDEITETNLQLLLDKRNKAKIAYYNNDILIKIFNTIEETKKYFVNNGLLTASIVQKKLNNKPHRIHPEIIIKRIKQIENMTI